MQIVIVLASQPALLISPAALTDICADACQVGQHQQHRRQRSRWPGCSPAVASIASFAAVWSTPQCSSGISTGASCCCCRFWPGLGSWLHATGDGRACCCYTIDARPRSCCHGRTGSSAGRAAAGSSTVYALALHVTACLRGKCSCHVSHMACTWYVTVQLQSLY
jgi:hypothetical protein